MKLKILVEKGVSIIEVWGDIQFVNSHELINSASSLQNQGIKHIVISWEHVGYIDSSAMGALVSIHKLFTVPGESRVVLFTPHTEHQYMLKQANFHTFLEIYENMKSALGVFEKASV